MPLYQDNQETVTPVAPSVEAIPVIGTSSIFTKLGDVDKISAYIEGDVWTVNYYGQHLSEDDTVTNFKDITDPTLKQLIKINNFELRTISSLTHVTDSNTGLTTVTGSSNVYPYISPIVGDTFTAKIDDGTSALFEVTSVTRLSIYKNSAWEITYTLIDYLNVDNLADLTNLVVQEVYFDISLLWSAGGALRTVSEVNRTISAQGIAKELMDEYYEYFYSYKTETFLVPGDEVVYDSYVVNFWNSVINVEYLDGRNIPRIYEFRDINFKRPYTVIWDVLLDSDKLGLSRCIREIKDVGISTIHSPMLYRYLSGSKIDFIRQPDNLDGIAIPVGGDGTQYVFSTAFYEGDVANQNPIEQVVTKYINGEAITFDEINDLFQVRINYTQLEKFYYYPILVALSAIVR